MFKEYNPMQYIAIDVANQYGLDKEIYEVRIQWVKDNITRLEDLEPQADEPILYGKAVRALRDAMAGKEIGHAVALDSVCSGMQLMSAVMGCRKGMSITGLIHQDERSDAYTSVTTAINEILKQDMDYYAANIADSMNTNTGLNISRKDAKDAVMTLK